MTTQIQNETIQGQIEKCHASIKGLDHSIKITAERRNQLQVEVLKWDGAMQGINMVAAAIRDHVAGLAKVKSEGKISEEDFQAAVKWVGEVHGLPGNLIEQARLKKAQTEGAVNNTTAMIEQFQAGIQAERQRIRELEALGGRVDDLDTRKATKTASEAKAPKKKVAKKATKKTSKTGAKTKSSRRKKTG